MLPNITGYRVAYGGAWVLVGDDDEMFVACCGPFDTPCVHCAMSQRGWRDPTCRFARWDLEHQCHRNDGQPLQPGQVCFVEARTQMFQQAAAS